MKIIVTDLTRFRKEENVCTAGFELESSRCVRPMPYLKQSYCKKLAIHPGAILEGNFSTAKKIVAPHTEDMDYQNLKYLGPATSEQFRRALMCGHAKSIADGFGIRLPSGQRCIPRSHTPTRSILTISVRPAEIVVVRDNWGKLKVHITDRSGDTYTYMPITDLGFYEYSQAKVKTNSDLSDLNDFIHGQKEVLLRIGLSRPWESDDGRDGYWIQANGIYTFPKYFEEVRCYRD